MKSYTINSYSDYHHVRQAIDKCRDTIMYFENYDADLEVYISTSTLAWNYSQERPYKGDTIEGERRAYLHIYYNRERAVSEEMEFNKLLISLVKELESGNTVPEH